MEDLEHAGRRTFPGQRARPLLRSRTEPFAHGVIDEHVAQRLAETLGGGKQTGLAVDDRAAMAADVGGDGRCPAGRRLGDRQPPPFGKGRAEHRPGSPILVGQVTPVHVAGELDPLGGVVGGDPRPQLACQWTVADEPQAQLGNRAPSLGRRLECEMETLDRGEPADGQHQRR